VGAGLLLGVAAGWFGGQLTTPSPGSMEHVFWSVRVGMWQYQAVALLQSCGRMDSSSISGITTDGRSFSSIMLDDLPPAREVERAELMVMDSDGQYVYVFLGQGGLVTGKRFDSGMTWEDRLLQVHRRLLGL
jgi:hypothetical protein